MSGDNVSKGAKALSRRGAQRGGVARAANLDAETRSDIARHAAEARWGKTTLDAQNVGVLQIGDREIGCAVLEGELRVINQQTFLTALGRARSAKGGTGSHKGEVPPFLSAANLRPFIPPDLREMAEPIPYRTPSGTRAYGYKAEILPAVCEVYLDAREARVLTQSQIPSARASEILLRGLARVGIIALIDEATGYQEVRARHELEAIMAAYVQAELRPWVKMFPDEFFKEIYRLQDWELKPGTSKRTPYVGKLVNKYVYDQLPPGVLDKLRGMNPRNLKGYRKHKFHQFLTIDTGNPHLDRQISTVTTLMRISKDQHEFEILFERALPPIQPRLPLVIDVDQFEEQDA